MKLEEYQSRLQDLVKETVTLLCQNALPVKVKRFSVDALICVTMDNASAFVLKVEETIGRVGADDAVEGERGDGDSSSRKWPPDGAARRKQSKRHRSDDDDVANGGASDNSNDSDHDAGDVDEANHSIDDSSDANDITDEADSNDVHQCDNSVKTEPASIDCDKAGPNVNDNDDDTHKIHESAAKEDGNLVTVKQEAPDDDAPLAPNDPSPSDDTVPDVKNVDDAWFRHTLIVLDGHTYMYMHEG